MAIKNVTKTLLAAVKSEIVPGYKLRSIELTNNTNRLSKTVDITYSYEPIDDTKKEDDV